MLPAIPADAALSTPGLSVVAVIPARFASTRLPGKVLADIGGRPMIEHVYRRATESRSVQRVIVATDDDRIVDAVTAFGGDVRRTRADHVSGGDRVAEVATDLDCDLVAGVQGDEPFLDPSMIDEAAASFRDRPSLVMSSLRRRIDDPADLQDANVVKVVVDRDEYALYFSRATIPFPRARGSACYRHVGLYVYRRAFLTVLSALTPTPLERAESLEQLRVLEHGYRIHVPETRRDSFGVDTPADLERARRLVASRSTAS